MSIQITYLEPTDPGAFQDMVKHEPTDHLTLECPVCLGYGGWNLRLDQYRPIPDKPGSQHFQTFCNHCWGWGWVDPNGPHARCPRHEFSKMRNIGRCLNIWICAKCGFEREVDSSD